MSNCSSTGQDSLWQPVTPGLCTQSRGIWTKNHSPAPMQCDTLNLVKDKENGVSNSPANDFKEQNHQEEQMESIASNTFSNKQPKKRRNGYTDTNMIPSKKPNTKKHRPKVIAEGRSTTPIIRTPKPKTPKKAASKNNTKRKSGNKRNIKVSSHMKDAKTEVIHCIQRKAAKSCRRALDFNLQHELTGEKAVHNIGVLSLAGDCSIVTQDYNSSMYQEGFHYSCLERYHKRFCYNFPTECKRKRRQRKRIVSKFWSFPLRSVLSNCLIIPHISKKRSVRPTRRCDIARLIAVPICNESPSSHVDQALPSDKTSEILHEDISPDIVSQGEKAMESIDLIIRKMASPDITDKDMQIILHNQSTQSLENGKGTLVPYSKIKKKKVQGKVDLDPETVRMWMLLMEKNGAEAMNEDEEKKEWWEKERKVFRGRVDSFIARMHLIQGNRCFSKWKGSVVDSVVGVFLTQNVSDNLSSSAYLSLAARFPPQSANDDELRYGDDDFINNQGSARTTMEVTKCDLEGDPLVDNGTEINITHQTKNLNSANMSFESNPLHTENKIADQKVNTPTQKKGKASKKVEEIIDWDSMRRTYSQSMQVKRSIDRMDSVNWEAVRSAPRREVAKAIEERGQNNVLAGRIQDFLNRIVKDHGSIDLEWLRDVPPDKAKEYLLSIRGLGLKSVECIRLLALQHKAFPVDTNVGRIAVRLGWAPLQPLPEELQIHLLEQYPMMDSIQKFLWPRLCTVDPDTLYLLHCHFITFGKVFCTKKKPNCNACPLRGECKHFASAFTSARLALPRPEEQSITSSKVPNLVPTTAPINGPPLISLPEGNSCFSSRSSTSHEPFVEEPPSPEPMSSEPASPEPISSEPGSPEPLSSELSSQEPLSSELSLQEPLSSELSLQEPISSQSSVSKPMSFDHALQDLECHDTIVRDIEDYGSERSDEIPLIKLNIDEFKANVHDFISQSNMRVQQEDVSKALVVLSSLGASIPMPKLKQVSRLRTEHYVYELPDSHPLLNGLENRDPDDICPYLLAIWSPGEAANLSRIPKKLCNNDASAELSGNECMPCCNIEEQDFVQGTILIPCRTAARGSFPLNGTYFQVNEVFADAETSKLPINVPRSTIWNLPRRTVYFGTSTSSIFKGLKTEEVQLCFWKGFICVRGFDRKTRKPQHLEPRLHRVSSRKPKVDAK